MVNKNDKSGVVANILQGIVAAMVLRLITQVDNLAVEVGKLQAYDAAQVKNDDRQDEDIDRLEEYHRSSPYGRGGNLPRRDDLESE